MNHLIFNFALAMGGQIVAMAELINVADHGVVPGKDATYALNKLVESVQGKEGVTLTFPKGDYVFYPENAIEMYRTVTNHDNSIKRMAFPFFNCKNLTLDGGGSSFTFHGRMNPIVVEGTKGITLKNFSIDWERPFHDELPVVANDEKGNGFTVEIDPEKYPHTLKHGLLKSEKYNWQDDMGSNMVFDPKTRAPIYNTRNYNLGWNKPYKATRAGKNRVNIKASGRSAPPVGSVLISYGRNPTSRLCPAIHLSSSSDVVIDNVTMYAAGGMGVIGERVENIHLKGVKVTSTADRMISTRADATHFLGCKGKILVEDCLFEHMLDDAINVHGAYIKVVDYLGDKEFLCEISHFQQWGLIFAEAGDKVALLSRETVLPFHLAEVTKTRVLNEHRVVVTVDQVPEDMPQGPMSIENLTWNPDFTFRKNIVRENRARSILVTTRGKVLIEDNYLSSQMHGILIEGDNKFWYESGAVEDVIIRNNEFVDIGFEGGERYPLFASPMLTPEQRVGEGHYHRNIHFVNNKLKSFNGLMVHALSVQGLHIEGNTMTFSESYPTENKYPAIALTYCDDVSIKGNKTVGFDRKLGITQSENSTKVKVGENEGFE